MPFDLSQILPKTNWAPTGALAGGIEGMRTGLGLQDLERAFRDSDLNNQVKMNEFEQTIKDQQAFGDVRRQATGLEFGDKVQDISSGGPSKRRASDLRYKDTMSDEGDQRINDKMRTDLGEVFQDVAEQTKESGVLPPHLYARTNKALERAKLPPLPGDPQQAWAAVQQGAQGFNASGARREKFLDRDSRESMNALNNQTRLAMTKQVADARAAAAAGKPLTTDQLAASLAMKIANGNENKAMQILASLKELGKDQMMVLAKQMKLFEGMEPQPTTAREGFNALVPPTATPSEGEGPSQSKEQFYNVPPEGELKSPADAKDAKDGTMFKYKGEWYRKEAKGLRKVPGFKP